MTSRGQGKAKLGMFVAVFAAGLGAASTAWACGTSMGWINVKSVSTGTSSYGEFNGGQTSTGNGPRGTTIKVTAGSLKPKPAKYALMYAPPGSGLDCHQPPIATQVLKTPAGVPLDQMKTNKGGKLDRDLTTTVLEAYKAQIPLDSPTGDAQICGKEMYPTPNDTYTYHVTFTVT